MKLDYQDGLVVGFTPRFKSYDDDWERYLFAIVDLADAGVIEKIPGQPLITYADKGSDWLRDQYLAAEKYAELEAAYTQPAMGSMAPPSETTQGIIDRFCDLGQTQRAKRIWRGHLAVSKSIFWQAVQYRNRGVDTENHWSGDHETAEDGHRELVERVATYKPELLDTLAQYRDWLAHIGARPNELDRATQDIAEVMAEQKAKPGKPDPRKMDEALFWEVMETGLGRASTAERLEALPDLLATFKGPEIRKFAALLDHKDAAAYRWPVWGLAYLLRGGCSDDAFDGFRAWLILQGRAVFEATIADPDGFDAPLFQGGSDGFESLASVCDLAYELRAGKPMKHPKRAKRDLGPEISEQDFAAHLPRIAQQMDTP